MGGFVYYDGNPWLSKVELYYMFLDECNSMDMDYYQDIISMK